jgi:hypothetical protein
MAWLVSRREIVTVLRDAGRDADAERWARRGLAEDREPRWCQVKCLIT